MTRDDRMALWMSRLESCDKVLQRADTGWQLEFWGRVRRQLVQQLNLLSINRVHEK
mgnify:FL=1